MNVDTSVLKEVKPVENRVLPDRFDLAHAVAFFFHDELAQLVVDLQRIGALSVTLDLGDAQKAEEFSKLEGEALWTWLQSNGHQDVIDDLTYRQLTAAVVADASAFLSESLIASGKGKTQVAYSLLRKPLKENLLLLEWLAGSPEDFLDRFNGESVSEYLLNRLSKEHRREIIHRAARAVDVPGADEELMWTVRYAKEYPNSLETLWTKATHLVTSVDAIATAPGNLNFVFSTASAVEEQWEHYYKILPLLLYYFVAVAEVVAARFVEWDSDLRSTQLMLRQIAFLRCSEGWDTPEVRDYANEVLEDLNGVMLQCVECDEAVTVEKSGVDRFWMRAALVCPSCSEEYSLWEILKASGGDANGT